jgi:photosystem I P700 chlorophyll a apoprotein A2
VWAIFFIRDYDPANKGNVLARMLEHKEAIISLKLGFFILGFHTVLYVHNDVILVQKNKFN